MASDTLLHEFPPVSTQAWEDVIAKNLKGADYAKKLVWQTEEGLAVKPYYRAEDIAGLDYLNAVPGNFPFVRGDRASADWRIREEIEALPWSRARKRSRFFKYKSPVLPIWMSFSPTCRKFPSTFRTLVKC